MKPIEEWTREDILYLMREIEKALEKDEAAALKIFKRRGIKSVRELKYRH